MDYKLTNEQKEYKREIIKFVKNELNDKDNTIPLREKWKKIAELGLLAMNIEEKYGGLDENYVTMALCLESMGYACEDNGLIFVMNNHLWVAQNLICLYGTDYLKNKYVSRMIEGQCIGCFALTEAEAGSDVFAMTTRADMQKDGTYKLNGNKIFISNASLADVIIVAAKTKNDKYTLFVVDRETEGVLVGKPIPKMGLESCPFAEISFQDCIVSSKNILGKIDGGAVLISMALDWERCFEFASNIGTMQRIMEKCIVYSKKRKQFGKPISEFQGVSSLIADMKVSIEMARCMLYKIAEMKDKGMLTYKESAIFKLFVSESYVRLCKNAMKIFGAYGYTVECGLENELRDAMGSIIYSGTNEIQKNIIYDMACMENYN